MGPPIRWNPAPIYNGDQVLVAFRVLGSRSREHWLNKVAVALTARPGTKHGKMCHVELMLQTDAGVWYRFGIVKKTWVANDENGNPIFEWGVVHGKRVDTSSWDDKYKFLSISVSRQKQKVAFDFLTSQIGHSFNYYGYLLNIILPGGIGVGEYHPRMHVEKHAWYCSQLVGIALQAMSDEEGMAGEHAPVEARHMWRVVSVMVSLIAGAGAGALSGIWLKQRAHYKQWEAVSAGVIAAVVVMSFVGTCISVMTYTSSSRRRFYGNRAQRHDACKSDWRHAIGTTTNFHQSSPNSLYDALLEAKGVTPSRDPVNMKLMDI